MPTTTSRRAILAGAAAMPALVAVPAAGAMAAAEPDPIFAVAAVDASIAAKKGLAMVSPTTLAGLVAVLDYAVSYYGDGGSLRR